MRKSVDKRKRFRKLFESIGGLYEQNRFLHSLGTLYESWIETETVLFNLKYLQSDRDNRVLHIGIGSGRVSKEVVCHGNKIIGVDIASSMLKYSSELLHQLGHGRDCDFVLSSMSHLPFREKCFDAVICIRTLKYAVHPFRVLQEAHRVLKQRGIFVVEFPNIKTYYSFLTLLDRLVGRRKLRVRYFVLDQMRKFVRTIGFDILSVKETLRLPRSLYMKVHRERVLEAAISIEQALSWLLPSNILTRSYILTCKK